MPCVSVGSDVILNKEYYTEDSYNIISDGHSNRKPYGYRNGGQYDFVLHPAQRSGTCMGSLYLF